MAIVTPLDGSLYSAQDSALALLADGAIRMTLYEAGQAANAEGCAANGAPSPAADASGTLRSGLCETGLWVHVNGSFTSVNDPTAIPGYRANAVGFLAGIDRPVGPAGTRIGVVFGYDQGWLNDGLGGNATQQVGRIGLYGSQPAGALEFDGAIIYGHDWDATNRPTGVGTATASQNGNEVSGGLQASLPLNAGGFAITPAAGVRFNWLSEGAFSDPAPTPLAGAFAVSGASVSFADVVPYARVEAAESFATASGLVVSPYARAGIDYYAGTDNPTVVLAAADGTLFPTSSVRLDRAAAVLGAGLNLGQDNWNLFANYDAHLAGNWNTQEVKVGLRIKF
jgi:outer membrane autotransporter protein